MDTKKRVVDCWNRLHQGTIDSSGINSFKKWIGAHASYTNGCLRGLVGPLGHGLACSEDPSTEQVRQNLVCHLVCYLV